MLDARIYRTSLLDVVVAVIVFAFALRAQPRPLSTTLEPDAFNGRDAYADMVKLAERYAHRPAGSSQDQALAGAIAARLRTDGFAVSTRRFAAGAGRRPRDSRDSALGVWRQPHLGDGGGQP